MVRALCDRRFGVGADGVIRVGPARDGADLTMDLRNADGSVAEMSGNGIRCLAQAAVGAGLVEPPTFTVATAAGARTRRLPDARGAGRGLGQRRHGRGDPGRRPAGVRRPAGADGRHGQPPPGPARPRPDGVDVAGLGRRLRRVPGGVNVEFISAGPGPDELTLRVWERGVGETRACGTGSVAAAAAARSWGLVGDRGGGAQSRAAPRGDRWCRRRAVAPVDRSTLSGRVDVTAADRGGRPDVTPSDSAFTDTLIARTFRERIILVGVSSPRHRSPTPRPALDELALLVDTAGADVVARIVQRRDRPDPATFIGRGKVRSCRRGLGLDADTVVFDDELTPAQQRNLERTLGRTAIDRTAVILDIFAQNARSPEGRARSSWPCSATGCPDCAAAATRSASRPVASAPVVPARPSSRSTGGAWFAGCTGWKPTSKSSTAPAVSSASRGPGAGTATWPWSATPTPGSRRCSTG